MGGRKTRTRSGPPIGDPIERRRKGKELVKSFVKDDDDSTRNEEQKMFEKLQERTEILLEVLSRLDPQTLLRVVCVSKGLCNFIREANFLAQNFRNCKAIAERALTGLFLQNKYTSYWSEEWNIIDFLSVELEAGGVPDPSLEFLKQKDEDDVVDIIDSCNGLLLCSNTTWARSIKTRFVCNPLTREKVVLPNPRKPFNRVSYALMADLDHNYLKYRVLCLVRSKSYGEQYSELSILCSETGEWMELQEKLPPVNHEAFNQSRVFFNGSLYWDCLEDHILVCDFNLKGKKPCYKLIEAPRAPLGRCLWKSKDRLHCYCHGYEDDFPEWTLCVNGSTGEDFKWKLEESEDFRKLTDDFTDALCVDKWIIERKAKPRIRFKIISYAPESNTLYLFIPDEIYTYQFTERRLEFLWASRSNRPRAFRSRGHALPYVHSLVPIQTAKGAAHEEAERGIGIANKTWRTNAEAETRCEMKKVKGRHNKRTPRCQDYSLVVQSACVP